MQTNVHRTRCTKFLSNLSLYVGSLIWPHDLDLSHSNLPNACYTCCPGYL